jgi:hypothetical protein
MDHRHGLGLREVIERRREWKEGSKAERESEQKMGCGNFVMPGELEGMMSRPRLSINGSKILTGRV